jgi:glycosyltransferase involved in cell wall biosynthesis
MATGVPAIVSDAVGCAEDLIEKADWLHLPDDHALADRMHAVPTLPRHADEVRGRGR